MSASRRPPSRPTRRTRTRNILILEQAHSPILPFPTPSPETHSHTATSTATKRPSRTPPRHEPSPTRSQASLRIYHVSSHRINEEKRQKEHTTRTTRQRYAGRTAGLARGSLTRRCGRCIARSRGRVFRGGTLSCVLANHGMFMDTGARTHLGEGRRAPRRYTSQRRRRRTATRCDGHGRVSRQWSAGGNRGGRQVP